MQTPTLYYLLTYFDDCTAPKVYSSGKLGELVAYLNVQHPALSGYIIDTEASIKRQFSPIDNSFFCLYNALSGEAPIRYFESKSFAIQKMLDLIRRRAVPVPSPRPQAVPASLKNKEKVMAKKDKAAVAAKVEAPAAPATKTKSAITGPGVISTLVDLLCDHGGGTVDELYKKLEAKFPERGEGMITTIRVQLARQAKQGKLNITKTVIEGRGTVYTAVRVATGAENKPAEAKVAENKPSAEVVTESAESELVEEEI